MNGQNEPLSKTTSAKDPVILQVILTRKLCLFALIILTVPSRILQTLEPRVQTLSVAKHLYPRVPVYLVVFMWSNNPTTECATYENIEVFQS
jgi:hypothetical protein